MGLRAVGIALGVGLVIAAVVAVARRGEELAPALDSIRRASPTLLAGALILPIAGLTLTATNFWILTKRYGRVGFLEMFALIGAAWLLNYLPFWPGMMGRIAYHRAVNNIPVTSSAAVLIWANVLNVLAALIVGAAVLAASIFFAGDDWRLALIGMVPVPITLSLGLHARRLPNPPDPHLWRLFAVLAVRMIEMHVWAARYAVCFALIGAPIAWGAALALACATQLASVVPIGGNALGWREWVTGLVAPLLPVGLTLASAVTLRTGLTAELLNRAVEVALAVPIGILASLWVARAAGRTLPR